MIPLLTLAERDKWICHICRQPVRKDRLGTKSRGAPTRDHVQAKSRGGKDTEDNLKLAHRGRNEQKGSRKNGVPVRVKRELEAIQGAAERQRRVLKIMETMARQ